MRCNVLRSGEAIVDLDRRRYRNAANGWIRTAAGDQGRPAAFRDFPIILMTSRADPADIRRGLDFGASAYITKQNFDQRELLATIGQLL